MYIYRKKIQARMPMWDRMLSVMFALAVRNYLTPSLRYCEFELKLM